ncbi:MAG: hypothetical protein ACRCWG_16985 [Sarcina sp.]
MLQEERAGKFQVIIDGLKRGDKFDLIDAINRDKTDERIRNILLMVMETGDIHHLDYEFDGGNVNLAYKSAEELLYSLELKREYPVINLYKATGSLMPFIVYRSGITLSFDKENNKIIFNHKGEIIELEARKNVVDTALDIATEISRFKLSPDPSMILEVLREVTLH